MGAHYVHWSGLRNNDHALYGNLSSSSLYLVLRREANEGATGQTGRDLESAWDHYFYGDIIFARLIANADGIADVLNERIEASVQAAIVRRAIEENLPRRSSASMLYKVKR